MIPIRLITGFLGSGKTTLLKNLIRQNQSHRRIFLVNEFSSVDIDGPIIADLTPDSLSIPGGSIFCRCLAGQFINYLQEIPRRFVTNDHPIDELVIEASGIADPRVIFRMLTETGLDRIYRIWAVMTIVDPSNFHKLLATLTSLLSQIEASDTVLINKIDQASPDTIAHSENLIRQINPSVRIYHTTFSRLPNDYTEIDNESPKISGVFALCRDPQFATLNFDDCNLTYPQLRQAITPIADEVYRLKGFFKDGRNLHYIDYSPAGWQIEKAPLEARKPVITVIVKGANLPKVREHLKRFGMN